MPPVTTTLGKADAALDQRLNDELDRFNAAATPDVAAAEELTVRIEEDGELVAGRRRSGHSLQVSLARTCNR